MTVPPLKEASDSSDPVIPLRQQLRLEISRLEHELRRVRDGLERNRTRALEQQAVTLQENIEMCRRELDSLA